MKRIAIISYHTCPLSAQEGKETGGMNVYVLELSKQLANLGYTIDVFTRDQDDSAEKIVEVVPGFRVIHLASGPKTTVAKKELIQYLPEFVESFMIFTQKENLSYDILDCHYYLSGLIGLQIKERINPKLSLFITFHTLALMKNLVARTVEEQETKARIDAEFTLIQQADAVIPTSRREGLYLQYLYGCKKEKIFVVTPGVNTSIYFRMNKQTAKEKLKLNKENKLILFVGRIEPLKGIDILMYAIKILIEKFPDMNVCLYIIGGDISQEKDQWSDELQRLEELRTTLSLKTSVTFLGRRRPEELPLYYNAADVVVMPSHYESFGMTALEAMACGTPVITTDVTGISDLTDEHYRDLLVTTSNNPLLLAKNLHTFLENKHIQDHVSKEIVTIVEKYDWKCVARRMENLYNKFLTT